MEGVGSLFQRGVEWGVTFGGVSLRGKSASDMLDGVVLSGLTP